MYVPPGMMPTTRDAFMEQAGETRCIIDEGRAHVKQNAYDLHMTCLENSHRRGRLFLGDGGNPVDLEASFDLNLSGRPADSHFVDRLCVAEAEMLPQIALR